MLYVKRIFNNRKEATMAKFNETDQIPYRHGLDELPADITRRELLYYFSFNHTERQFLRAKGRFPAHQIVLGIY
jgi:hypothetical protein